MQVKYNNQIRNKVITIELETTNFTDKEKTALDKFGEPIIRFEKLYEGEFPVKIEKKIRSGFKVRVKFDGNKDLQAATEAANLFFEEIQEELSSVMAILMDKLRDLEVEFKSSNGFLDIKY